MTHGSIIGYDINAKMCQISYYNEKTQEPETVDTGIEKENNQIPLVMNYYKETWTYGRQARRMSTVRDSICVEGIWECALGNRKIEVDGQEHEGVQLLADFVKYTLNGFEEIESITFTVPEKNEDIRVLLKGIGQKLGVAKENIYVQDYKESFCHYMFNQPKELWQYEAALFYCDEDVIRAYMLRELKNSSQKSRESFVTVDKVADARMEELEAVYPVLHVEKAKAADEHFKRFIQSVFNKKMISSVFLTGDGFENNWYPNSLRVLCNGRRAFMGNNLYSKGACYTAQRRKEEQSDAPVYLDETKLTEQISVRMRVNGEEGWYPLVSWGNHWYESDRQFEVLLGDTEDIEIHVDSLVTGRHLVESVSLKGLPDRKNYALRLKISTFFSDEKTCHIIFEDMGFGEFFAPSGFRLEKIIELGGSNGQFNSLS
ncbi:MAG: hypothetical protein JTJ27_05670 [Coprococcus sp.]|nr:hypothetical protein [Coprococcus sp.]